MSKIIMTLHIPEPKVRKKAVKAVQKHKDKSKYNRKTKHKAPERYQSDRGFCLGDAVLDAASNSILSFSRRAFCPLKFCQRRTATST